MPIGDSRGLIGRGHGSTGATVVPNELSLLLLFMLPAQQQDIYFGRVCLGERLTIASVFETCGALSPFGLALVAPRPWIGILALQPRAVPRKELIT